jgi:hypothetical protein
MPAQTPIGRPDPGQPAKVAGCWWRAPRRRVQRVAEASRRGRSACGGPSWNAPGSISGTAASRARRARVAPTCVAQRTGHGRQPRHRARNRVRGCPANDGQRDQRTSSTRYPEDNTRTPDALGSPSPLDGSRPKHARAARHDLPVQRQALFRAWLRPTRGRAPLEPPRAPRRSRPPRQADCELGIMPRTVLCRIWRSERVDRRKIAKWRRDQRGAMCGIIR